MIRTLCRKAGPERNLDPRAAHPIRTPRTATGSAGGGPALARPRRLTKTDTGKRRHGQCATVIKAPAAKKASEWTCRLRCRRQRSRQKAGESGDRRHDPGDQTERGPDRPPQQGPYAQDQRHHTERQNRPDTAPDGVCALGGLGVPVGGFPDSSGRTATGPTPTPSRVRQTPSAMARPDPGAAGGGRCVHVAPSQYRDRLAPSGPNTGPPAAASS